MSDTIVRLIRLARLRLAIVLFGGGWGGVISRLWLIRERAMAAVTREGRVDLANCQALADALYENIPGKWQLTIIKVSDSGSPTE